MLGSIIECQPEIIEAAKQIELLYEFLKEKATGTPHMLLIVFSTQKGNNDPRTDQVFNL